MLLPAINKRAEHSLKSSRADALSRTRLFLHCWLLLSQKLFVVIAKGQREAMLTSLSLRQDWCRSQKRGTQTQRSGKGGSRTAASMKDATSSWVSAMLAGELWRRGRRQDWSLQHTSRYRENKLLTLLAKLSGHWFPGTCSHFPEVKEFPWRAGLEIFCCTIFSLPGGHPAPLRDMNTKPCFSCACVFASLFDQSLCYSMWPLFQTCLSLFSPGPTSDISPLTLLFCVGEKAALLRYKNLGSLLKPFILHR